MQEREAARELRAQGLTLAEIAARLDVSKGSVSAWVRDVPFTPRLPLGHFDEAGVARRRKPNVLQRRKAEEVERLRAEGIARVGRLNERELLLVGAALYAGEGAKRDGAVSFANSNPAMVVLFLMWLRQCFSIDESRLRVKLYLHQGLDETSAIASWSALTDIPASQFTKSYRATPDAGIRHTKHLHGCATVVYNCARTHREIMGLCHGLLGAVCDPG